MAGRCYTELGKPRRAESLLTSAIARYDQALVRENSLYLSWLAEDYEQLGEIEHAASIATQMAALAAGTNSARTDTRLRYSPVSLALTGVRLASPNSSTHTSRRYPTSLGQGWLIDSGSPGLIWIFRDFESAVKASPQEPMPLSLS